MLLTKSSEIKPVECLYVSAGCNQTTHCVDWGPRNNLISYGSSCSVIIYDPSIFRVVHTLTGHTARVNVVKWVCPETSTDDEVDLISASSDSHLIHWTLNEGQFTVSSVLSGHSGSVNNFTAIQNSQSTLFTASASSDSTVKIWVKNLLSDVNQFQNTDTIDLNNGLCLALEFHLLPGNLTPVLALSTDNFIVYLYHVDGVGKSVKLASLAGHEDWVQDFAFIDLNSEEILLASCSQDTTVRLWKFSTREEAPVSQDEFQLDKVKFNIEGKQHTVALESVLMGHEGWVYSVNWTKNNSSPILMTASSDRAILMWSASDDDDSGGVWMERVRLGKLGGEQLGYLGARFSGGGRSLVAHDHQGAFHVWFRTNQDEWVPGVGPSGHFDGVSDIAWEMNGRYLLSTSLDQTTRIHASWVRDSDDAGHREVFSWHEIARPQVHGYSINSIAALNNFGFVSGADEKVARAFGAPRNFLEWLARLSKINLGDEVLLGAEPTGATVPALGLSNKAIFTDENDLSINLEQPPNEDTLLQNTLWPETMKLYGHGNELYSTAATHVGDLVATACKQTSSQDAPIILWKTSSWEKTQNFCGKGHSLTVTQMAFSPDDKFLLSVSRDRNWCLFERKGDDSFKLRAVTTKDTTCHKRIIWGCSWSHDSTLFATVSRDSLLAVWDVSRISPESKNWIVGSRLLEKESPTAVDFAWRMISRDRYLLAVGYESGRIELCSFQGGMPGEGAWSTLCTINDSHRAIKRILFRPPEASDMVFASCSLDNSVRLYCVRPDLLS